MTWGAFFMSGYATLSLRFTPRNNRALRAKKIFLGGGDFFFFFLITIGC